MMKILSIFPGFVGAICILILLGSIIGFSHQEKINDIPIVPCSDDEDIGCRIGMTSSDINVPNAFKLLQIEVEKYKEAIVLSDVGLEIFPAQPLLYLVNGVANNELKNIDQAIEDAEKATGKSLSSNFRLPITIE